MALRLLGAAVAVLLALFAALRYRKGILRRGELLAVSIVSAGLVVAAVEPRLLNPLLSALGFEPGGERRIIGLLVISNLFMLALLFRGFSRDDLLSNELGVLVDRLAVAEVPRDQPARLRGGCAVVIPAYNEAENLPWVLGRIPKEVGGLRTTAVVVADGCTDTTEEVAAAHGAIVVRRSLRRGSGAAVRLGCEIAVEAGSDVVVILDADGQHDPAEMTTIVAPLLAREADMVQGSRALGSFEVESTLRRVGVPLFARLLSILGGVRITDPSTGYRALTAQCLRTLDLKQDQFYVSELILDAARKGMTVIEVPITLRRRGSGSTKKPRSLRYAWGFSKAIVRTWLR